MGTEIAKQERTREQLLDLMKPVKERFGSQQEEQNAALVAFELNIVSLKVGRFGWEQMDAGFKDRLTADWVSVLEDFPINEVRRGIGDCLEEFPRTCPTEHAVKAAIMARRSKAIRSAPKPPQPEPPRQELTDEERAQRKAFAEKVLNGFGGT